MHSRCHLRLRGGPCFDDRDCCIALRQVVEDDSDDSSAWGKVRLVCVKSGEIFKLVEMLAQRCIRQGKVCQPPVPIELVSLVDPRRAVEIRMVPLKAHHAAIWRLQDAWVIQLKSDDTTARKKFSLFHEAFHILAHGGGSPVFRKAGLRMGSFNELLADCFAIYVMMPEKLVRERWAEIKNLAGMAEIFEVPKGLMHMRLRYLDLI